MNISSAFNKYYHAILNDFWKLSRSLRIVIRDSKTGEVTRLIDEDNKSFILWKNEDYDSMGDKDSETSLKYLLKLLNFNYPKDEDGKPISTIKVSNEDLLLHLLTIEEIADFNNIELSHIKAEREQFMRMYANY